MYRVEIVESSSREYGAIAHWNAFKRDRKIVDQSTIYNAAPPPYFYETYTDYAWLTSSQLWLGKGSPKSLQQYDEISIAIDILPPPNADALWRGIPTLSAVADFS